MQAPSAPCGLLLLTGGQGRRYGAPKHGQPHPAGGSWGGHLVAVFEAAFPDGPVQLLGEALPDRPDLAPLADPREGPAVALRHWAAGCRVPARRWWAVACDQVRWTSGTLAAWHAAAVAADPAAASWVLGRFRDRLQPLGGFLAGDLLAAVAGSRATSLLGLAEALPRTVLAVTGEEWLDVDTPAGFRAWRERG